MTGKLSCNINCLVLSFLLLAITTSPLFSQVKELKGIINDYGRVESFGTDWVIIKDDGANAGQFSKFEAGDTILLIQMKGVKTYASELGSYGTYEGPIGKPGEHEFLIAESVEAGTRKITFRNNIIHSGFSTEGDLQIVKVPTYNAAVVTDKLTCAPWDSLKKTGGVLSVIIGRTLVLNDSIDVSGKGFLGGATALGMGICVETAPLKMNKYAYAATAGIDSSGFKGEGFVSKGVVGGIAFPIYPRFAKGTGANLISGGGGNGRFSGGGGGANYGSGGTGGQETGCTLNRPGGIGGLQIAGTFLDDPKKMFMGAGGGASTFIAGGSPSAGGNGGGIILIVSDTIKGNSNIIRADGAGAKDASGNAGAGGGGAAGTVALYIQSYSNLTLAARGGKGGDNVGSFGEGGGGGGGFIATNTPSSATSISRLYTGGLVGQRNGSETGTGGNPGKSISTWTPILNGFLFNSIRSSVTNTQTDSICSNQVPKPVTGTVPVGGSGTYSYTWQKSYDLSGLPSLIGGAILKDYVPAAAEADTFWIRRIVKDEVNLLTDTSKWVQINVTPEITGNLVGKDTIICFGQNPLSLNPRNAGPSEGNGHYYYQWLQNPDNINWTTSPNAAGTSDGSSYDPPALTATTYYQRKVTSGRCFSYSSSVKITVLPLITGNTMVSADTVICEGTRFNKLRVTTPGGGFTGDYDFQWQDSSASAVWQSTSVADITAGYIPDTSKFAAKELIYFRRIVYSGPDSVCVSKSAPVLLTRWHKIGNNLISPDIQTICSGSVPANLTGTVPVMGDHVNYLYQWQDSSKLAGWTTRYTSSSPYTPPSLADTTWYRRVVASSACRDTSNKVVVDVHDPIINNIVEADTTVCNGADPEELRGKLPSGGNGTFGYQWYSSSDNFASNNVSISASGTSLDYDPPVLSASLSYRREVISGACKTFSNVLLVTVLPSITANTIAPDKPEVCFNTLPNPISGTPLTGGAGGTPTWIWQDSIAGGAWTNIAGGSLQNYTHTSNLQKQTWYRRIIRSGPADCCIDTSAIAVIDTLRLPTAVMTSVTDTTICNGSEVKLRITLTGAAGWNLAYNENSTPVNINNILTGKYTITRVPAAGSSVQTFNYNLAGLTDANGCAAVAGGLSGTRKAVVYRIPVTEAGSDDQVCGPVYQLKAVPSDGTGMWTFPGAVVSGDPSLYNTTVAIDSSFTTANVTYKFIWKEQNGICSSKDSVLIRFDNRIDPVDAGTGGDIMSFDNAVMVNASDLLSFESGLWTIESGSGDIELPESDSTYIKGLVTGENSFRWTVTNGACVLSDIITFIISNPVIPELVSPNEDGINDDLTITGLDFNTQTIELTILNGAGTPVFSTTNKNGNSEWENWNGLNSKGVEMPEGTYYYLLKVSSGKVPGNISKRSGFIILKRQ